MISRTKILQPNQLKRNCSAMPYDSLTSRILKRDIYKFDDVIYTNYYLGAVEDTFCITYLPEPNRVMFAGQLFASAISLSSREEFHFYMPQTCVLEEISLEKGRVLVGMDKMIQVRYGLVSSFLDNFCNFKVIRYMVRKKYGHMSFDDVKKSSVSRGLFLFIARLRSRLE